MAPQSVGTGITLLIFTIASGILPALFWLWFWLKEDQKHPEPKWVVIRVFILGSLIVIPAYFLEKLVAGQGFRLNGKIVFSTVVLWSVIEEGLKYIAVYLGAFKSRFFDEPIDAMIYMITGAIGFAAVENTLFMINALNQDGASDLSFLLTGNFRFIGATIVHIVASAIVGCFVGLAFYDRRAKRILATAIGLIVAISLHALFNYTIISQGEDQIMTAFVVLWLLAILVIFLFERVKNTIIKIKIRQSN
jgi:RsiW-degrading membrane proteinase PrsW (M82 family)